MFVHYYSLRDPKRLPQKGFFLDPIDSTEYRPTISESLQEFTNRVALSREEKGLDPIPHESLEVLITTSLSETTPKREQDQYFVNKAINPSMGQLWNLAKTIVNQRLSGKQVDYKLRQERANACLGCKLHKSQSGVSWAATQIINKAASLEVIQESTIEKKLGICGACGCGLKSKTRFDILPTLVAVGPADILKMLQVYREQAYSKCWILKEAINRQDTKQLLENKLQHLPPEYRSTLQAHLASSTQKARNGKP